MISITHPNFKNLTVRKRQGERALAILLVFCSDLRMKSSNIGGGELQIFYWKDQRDLELARKFSIVLLEKLPE